MTTTIANNLIHSTMTTKARDCCTILSLTTSYTLHNDYYYTEFNNLTCEVVNYIVVIIVECTDV